MRIIAATGARVHEVLCSRQHWHHALHAGQIGGAELRLIGKGARSASSRSPAILSPN